VSLFRLCLVLKECNRKENKRKRRKGNETLFDVWVVKKIGKKIARKVLKKIISLVWLLNEN